MSQAQHASVELTRLHQTDQGKESGIESSEVDSSNCPVASQNHLASGGQLARLSQQLPRSGVIRRTVAQCEFKDEGSYRSGTVDNFHQRDNEGYS